MPNGEAAVFCRIRGGCDIGEEKATGSGRSSQMVGDDSADC